MTKMFVSAPQSQEASTDIDRQSVGFFLPFPDFIQSNFVYSLCNTNTGVLDGSRRSGN